MIVTFLLALQLAIQLAACIFAIVILVMSIRMERPFRRSLQRGIRPLYLILMVARRVTAMTLTVGEVLLFSQLLDVIILPLSISVLILIETAFQLYDIWRKWLEWQQKQA